MLSALLARIDKVFRRPKAPDVFLDIIRTASPLVRHLGWLRRLFLMKLHRRFSIEPQSCTVTNPCFQTLLLSKAVLLGRKASLSGLRRAFVRSLDRPLDQSVVWPAMLVRIRACLFLFFSCMPLPVYGIWGSWSRGDRLLWNVVNKPECRWTSSEWFPTRKASVAWWHWVLCVQIDWLTVLSLSE